MKETNYTDHRVKLLFIAGMILVFIILFASFLYSKQSDYGSIKFLDTESVLNFRTDSEYCLNDTIEYPLHGYAVNSGFCLIKING
ncbi:MAG: hypothetical protein P8Z35_24655 [Ignavibacteriaceae bacterium]|jgi:hypothetical protein